MSETADRTPRKHVTCPYCYRTIGVRPDGRLMPHEQKTAGPAPCPGSNLPVTDLKPHLRPQ